MFKYVAKVRSNLAETSPDDALKNADTYRLYAEDHKNRTIIPWAILVILLHPLLGCQSSRLLTKPVPITVELRKVGDDQIQWTLQNQSNRYVVYENRTTPGGLPSDRFDLTTLGGTRIHYKGPMVDSWVRAREFYTIVAPMSRFSIEVNLAESYELPREMAFKVRCRTSSISDFTNRKLTQNLPFEGY